MISVGFSAFFRKMYIEFSGNQDRPEILIEFPMAKAGMDTVQQWAEKNQQMDIEQFVIAGVSVY